MLEFNIISRLFFIIVLYSSFIITPVFAGTSVTQGDKLAKEFCIACHLFTGTEQAGSLGPPLKAMRARFPDRNSIYKIIYDPAVALKPHTMMPPFGRNKLLTKEEINKIIDFLYSL